MRMRRQNTVERKEMTRNQASTEPDDQGDETFNQENQPVNGNQQEQFYW